MLGLRPPASSAIKKLAMIRKRSISGQCVKGRHKQTLIVHDIQIEGEVRMSKAGEEHRIYIHLWVAGDRAAFACISYGIDSKDVNVWYGWLMSGQEIIQAYAQAIELGVTLLEKTGADAINLLASETRADYEAVART